MQLATHNVYIIDRRVSIVEPKNGGMLKVSELAAADCVVLLGEPGIGKSTVLEQEAARRGAALVRARALINGDLPPADRPWFVDALDEYRADGSAADKTLLLARALASQAAPWWLACRGEDWRGAGDLATLVNAARDHKMLVAQLLPLDEIEASTILAGLGEADPAGFIARASALGAHAFVESPLSLILLRSSIAARGGAWPASRFELFDSAVLDLAYEHDAPRQQHRGRTPVSEIVDVAARACLMLRVSGAQMIWRSSAPPPRSSDPRDCLPSHLIGAPDAQLATALDTALFRGEGAAFTPVHLAVADFLAGRALAEAIAGGRDRASLPLSRALALIAGVDGKPPTELRGLFAWVAAHLARAGNVEAANRLIALDAVTILGYGDAAAFGLEQRRAILNGLDRDDPFFRFSEQGATALSGLAQADMEHDFAALLRDPDGGHRLATVLDVLVLGAPIRSMRPLLEEVALDPDRLDWQRKRAIQAWLNGSDDRSADAQYLIAALEVEPASATREDIRIHLLSILPDDLVSTEQMKRVLHDFALLGERDVIGGLYPLRRSLEARPRRDLFEQPSSQWLWNDVPEPVPIEVANMIDRSLAALIKKSGEASAETILRWTFNGRCDHAFRQRDETAKALDLWVGYDTNRAVDLLVAIGRALPDHSPWAVTNVFHDLCGRIIDSQIVEEILRRSELPENAGERERYVGIAGAAALRGNLPADVYWDLHLRVSAAPASGLEPENFTTCKVEDWRWRLARHDAQERQKAEATRQAQVARLTPIAAELALGQHSQELVRAAQLFLHADSDDWTPEAGYHAVAAQTNAALADALLAGCVRQLALTPFPITVSELGSQEGRNRTSRIEPIILAGIVHICAGDPSALTGNTPLESAFIIFKTGYFLRDDARRAALERWAVDRLNADGEAGALAVADYVRSSSDSGAEHSTLIAQLENHPLARELVERALADLLENGPYLAEPLVLSLIGRAASLLAHPVLARLAHIGGNDSSRTDAERRAWLALSFRLDPGAHGEEVLAMRLNGGERIAWETMLVSGLGDEAGEDEDEETAIERCYFLVRALGGDYPPVSSFTDVDHRGAMGHAVERQLVRLGKSRLPAAGPRLLELSRQSGLAAWHKLIRHVLAMHMRARRDNEFRHPEPARLADSLSGGAPASASDLLAIGVDVIDRIRHGLRTSDEGGWKDYWNTDSYNRPIDARVEEACRDRLLGVLRPRLESYQIGAVLPEARRANETRTDLLVLGHRGSNLPVEIKRNNHPDLWTAAATQLLGYAGAPGAQGLGIYLVFWFGDELVTTPPPGGTMRPESAGSLETMLIESLPPQLAGQIVVRVIDVSKPAAR